MTELVKYDAALRMLAEAVAVDEVLEIRNQAEAMRQYARQAKNRDGEIQSAQIRFRAERRLGELIKAQKETVGLNRGRAGAGRPILGDSETELPKPDDRPTLKESGIDLKLSMRAQKMAAIEPEKFERLLERHREEVLEGNNRVSVDLTRTSAEADGRERRRNLAHALSDTSAELPTGRLFPCVYADPPWHARLGISDRAYENHYSTMSWDAICAMPVADLLLPDAWVFLWIPRAHMLALHPVDMEFADDDGRVITRKVKLPLAWAVARAWGCDSYSTCFVWTKTDQETPDAKGMGMLVRDQDEILLLFKRGRGLPKPATCEKYGSNHRERAREHSRKPDHYRDMIRTMTGGVPVLELFARVDAEHPLPPDWQAWGNQAAQILVEIPEPAKAGDASQDGVGPSLHPDFPAPAEPAAVEVGCGQAPEFNSAGLSEFDALKAFSDFCFPDRIKVLTAIAPDHIARGLAYRMGGRDDWGLTEAGWKRFYALDAERKALAAAALENPPEIVDGVVQCRMPLDDDEIDLQAALRAIDAGEPVDADIVRHLVGIGYADCTTTQLYLTDQGRAFLAGLVDLPLAGRPVLDLPLFLAARPSA